jgi:hypothetical protein
MRLRITRSGGFISAPSTVDIDTATASPPVGKKAQALLAALGQPQTDPSKAIPDAYSYSVSFPDADVNETMVAPRSDAESLAAALYQEARS